MWTHRPIRLLVLLALASFAQSSATPVSAQGRKPIMTTLCSIVDNPRKYDRRFVQFAAHYESDGIEHSILVDESKCKWGIAPRFPEHLVGEEELERAIYVDHPGTQGKVISAMWTGVFQYHPRQIPRWVLQLRRMDDFRFTCDDCSELHKDDPIHLPEPSPPKWPPSTQRGGTDGPRGL